MPVRRPRLWTTRARADTRGRMELNWQLIFIALGLAFLLEGLPYFILAERMPGILLLLASRPPRALRILGLTSMILGVLLVALGRSF